MKKTNIFIILITLFILSGCNWTFNEYRQETYRGINEEFTLFLNASAASPSSANKTLAVGLRLPDGCSFVSGWYNDSNTIQTGTLSLSSYVTSRLNDSVCSARTGYRWVGLIGDEWASVDASDNFGEVNITCNVSGGFELDIGLEGLDDGFGYSCDNFFDVLTGSGTPSDPIGVHTCDALELMESDSTGYYQLNNDIDCVGSSFDGVTNNFYGSFDGQGYTISNLDVTGNSGIFYRGYNVAYTLGANFSNLKLDNITATGTDGVAALVGESGHGSVWNIEVANSYIECTSQCGGVIGELRSSTDYINNLTVHHSVINSSGSHSGGVIGECDIVLPNSALYSYENFIKGSGEVGGVCGAMDRSGVYSEMKAINLTINGGTATGGLVGLAENGQYSEFYAENIDLECTSHCGGVFGRMSSSSDGTNIIAHNITTDSTSYTGGIVGYLTSNSDLSNILLSKYSATNTDENRTGIIAGYVSSSGSVLGNIFYNDVNVGVPDICGNISADFTYCTNTYVSPKTDVELRLESTYTNWDFTNDFALNPAKYPHFRFDPNACTEYWNCVVANCNGHNGIKLCSSILDGNVCGAPYGYGSNYTRFTTTCPWFVSTDYDSESTDLDLVDDYTNVTSFTLSNGGSRVRWQGNVDINNTNLSTSIKVGRGFVSVDSGSLDSSIDTPADVTISTTGTNARCGVFDIVYSDTYYTTRSEILANGVIVANQRNIGGSCNDASICRNVRCVGTTLTFEAQHFDGFAIQQNQAAREGCENVEVLVFIGLGLIALAIIVIAAFAMIKISGGDVTVALLTGIAITAIGLGVVVMVGYIIISNVSSIVC